MAGRASGGATRVDAPDDVAAELSGIALLRAASELDLGRIAETVEWYQVPAGEILFAQGDASDGMYGIVRGRLECVIDGSVVREVGTGDSVGELALLIDDRRTATVRAVRDSLVVRLAADDLPRLLHSSPSTALELARMAARAAVPRSSPDPEAAVGLRLVAVVSLDATLPAAPLADDVARSLGDRYRTTRVDLDELRAIQDEHGSDAVVRHLAELEDRFDTVVVTLRDPAAHDDADVGLMSVVLRQMDLVVVGARPGARLDPTSLDAVGAARRPVSVVVVHRRGTIPRRTCPLLDAIGAVIEVRDHVHVAEDSAADLERLARILSGRSIGLVLGGGGSRGFAHIGVVRALREVGIPIDRLGGSSMGAIMAAQIALGWSHDEMLERNAAVWSRRGLLELGVPTLSLLRGRRAAGVFDALFADHRIEDLWRSYFCTTVNLSTFKLHVAREGPVATWARASATVPGLWPPVVDDEGNLHTDGGSLDNVPTGLMRAGNVGSVIGVDVCNRQSPMRVSGSGILPTGLRVILERRRRWVPTILDVLNRANLLASLQTHEQAASHADLFLAPPVEEQGFAAFDRIRSLAELGYRFAMEQLEAADLSSIAPRAQQPLTGPSRS